MAHLARLAHTLLMLALAGKLSPGVHVDGGLAEVTLVGVQLGPGPPSYVILTKY